MGRKSKDYTLKTRRVIQTIIAKRASESLARSLIPVAQRPEGAHKRGRKPLAELRVIKYVRLSEEHMAILNNVKRQLRTGSTSRAIKFCIEQYGIADRGGSDDGTVQETNA